MSTKRRITKVEQREATRKKLIDTAKKLFSQAGYASVSTENLVSSAGVTRGALYHHFRNKKDLFLAVFEEAQQEIASRIREAASKASEPWQELLMGSEAFLEACIDPRIQQIVTIDAPSILGWDLWREIDEQYGFVELKESLNNLRELGVIQDIDIESLAHLLSGAMNDAILWIAKSSNQKTDLKRTLDTLETLLSGIRAN